MEHKEDLMKNTSAKYMCKISNEIETTCNNVVVCFLYKLFTYKYKNKIIYYYFIYYVLTYYFIDILLIKLTYTCRKQFLHKKTSLKYLKNFA